MNRFSAAAVMACIATGAAGFVFGAVVGAAGFGVLSSAARDSERTKLAMAEAKLTQLEARNRQLEEDFVKQHDIVTKLREKHPELLQAIRDEGILTPGF